MEGEPKIENSLENKDFSKAKEPKELIDILRMSSELAQYAESMNLAYRSIGSELSAEDYIVLINSAPEIGGIRAKWQDLLNRELLSSVESLEDFVKKISLFPEVPSGAYKDKNGLFFAEMIKEKMGNSSGDDSSGIKQSIQLSLIKSMPSAFGMREKLIEIFS